MSSIEPVGGIEDRIEVDWSAAAESGEMNCHEPLNSVTSFSSVFFLWCESSSGRSSSIRPRCSSTSCWCTSTHELLRLIAFIRSRVSKLANAHCDWSSHDSVRRVVSTSPRSSTLISIRMILRNCMDTIPTSTRPPRVGTRATIWKISGRSVRTRTR
jgi:hypothetical protein